MSDGLDDLDSKDHLVRAMGIGAKIRAIAVRSTGVGRTLLSQHKTGPTATAALTRVATACLLMGGTITGREQISLQLRGNGPLGGLLAIANAHGHVRASIDNPEFEIPARADGKLDIASAIGIGELIVSKSLMMKEPYHGVVPLLNGGIGEDLAHYYTISEQKPTMVGLGEFLDENGVQAAGGFILQRFPGVEIDDEELAAIEQRLQSVLPLSDFLKQGASPTELLAQLLPDMTVIERYPVQCLCTCSRERYAKILIGLGVDELTNMLEEDSDTELRCHFCNTCYNFDHDALRILLAAARGALN